MSTFRAAARGAGWMLAAQALTSIGQFCYAAFTARIFTPLQFGAFAAALALQGLIALLTTTGFPSYVLGTPNLSKATAWKVRRWAIYGGLFAAGLYLLASGPWQVLLKAEVGGVFIPLLAASQAIAPLAAVQSAILRRDGHARKDAFCLLGSFIVANGASTVVLFLHRELWALALAPLVYPVALLVLSTFSNRTQLPFGDVESTRKFLGFSRKVSAQNVAFLVLQQSPGWLLSARLGAEKLGYFSRASTMAGMPATALTTALTRALQPHWRKLDGAEGTTRAVHETAVLASALAFPIFGLLIAHAYPIITLWLGNEWIRTADYVPFLAFAYALTIPFSILANSAEARGLFTPVRRAQIAMTLGLVPGIVALWLVGDPILATIAMAASQLCGFLTLVTFLSPTRRSACRTLGGVLMQAMWASLICGVGWVISFVLRTNGSPPFFSEPMTQVVVGFSASMGAWLLLFRWNESASILRRRGVQPTRVRSLL